MINFIKIALVLCLLSITFVQAEDEERKVKKTANMTKSSSVQIGGDKVEKHLNQGNKFEKLSDKKGRKMEEAGKKKSKKKGGASGQSLLNKDTNSFEKKRRVGPDTDKPVPTAVFHGFKQSCYDAKVVENVNEIREGTGGIAECIEIGDGVQSSVFSSMVKQSKEACKKILEHPVFGKRQFNVVGMSQGSLIARFIVETCQTHYPVRNLVTIGGPNNGMEIGTDCSGNDDKMRCQIYKRIKTFPMLDTYHKLIQQSLGPTNYMRDFQQHQNYVHKAIFLPYLNNEKENSAYHENKRRFKELNSMSMIMFDNDSVIFPKESEWFGQLDGQGKLVNMEQTEIYEKDTFGLKTLDQEGRVFKYQKNGEHLEYGPIYIQRVIVPALLR